MRIYIPKPVKIYLRLCLRISLPFCRTLHRECICMFLKWRWKKENDFWNQFDPIFYLTLSSRPDTKKEKLIWIFKKSEFVWPCNFLSAIYFVLFSKIFRTNSGVKKFRHFNLAFSFHLIFKKQHVNKQWWFKQG